MSTNGHAQQIVQKLWNYCNILRDEGLSYGDHVEQLTFLRFLKMAHEHIIRTNLYLVSLPLRLGLETHVAIVRKTFERLPLGFGEKDVRFGF